MNIPNRKNSSVPLLFHIFFLRFLRALRRLFLFPFRRRRPSERGRKREGGKEKKYSKKREQKERGYFVVTPPLLFSPSFLPNNREGVTAAEGGA